MDAFFLKVKRARVHTLPIPSRANESDAGLDLPLDLEAIAALFRVGRSLDGHNHGWDVDADGDGHSRLNIQPGGFLWVPTGWCFELHPGYEGQIRGRSGLAFKHGLTVGHVGTVDAGFRGEVKVALVNHGRYPTHLKHGDRIAQLVINAVPTKVIIDEARVLGEAPRGEKGYGSSGR